MRPTGMRLAVVALLAVALSACSSPASSPSSPPATTSRATVDASPSETPCSSPPDVQYAGPDGVFKALRLDSTVTVDARVNQPVTVRFVGDCSAGGRLMVNGTGAGQDTSFTTVWSGKGSGSWSPDRPGTRTLLVAFACTGPISCPLAMLAHIQVVTPSS